MKPTPDARRVRRDRVYATQSFEVRAALVVYGGAYRLVPPRDRGEEPVCTAFHDGGQYAPFGAEVPVAGNPQAFRMSVIEVAAWPLVATKRVGCVKTWR